MGLYLQGGLYFGVIQKTTILRYMINFFFFNSWKLWNEQLKFQATEKSLFIVNLNRVLFSHLQRGNVIHLCILYLLKQWSCISCKGSGVEDTLFLALANTYFPFVLKKKSSFKNDLFPYLKNNNSVSKSKTTMAVWPGAGVAPSAGCRLGARRGSTPWTWPGRGNHLEWQPSAEVMAGTEQVGLSSARKR